MFCEKHLYANLQYVTSSNDIQGLPEVVNLRPCVMNAPFVETSGDDILKADPGDIYQHLSEEDTECRPIVGTSELSLTGRGSTTTV